MNIFIAKHRNPELSLKRKMSNTDIRRFERLREVLPGFPWDGIFQTKEEIMIYLNGDRVICLLCGKPYKGLGLHLHRIHNITVEAYKLRYGLPWTRGMNCLETTKIQSENMKTKIQNGTIPINTYDASQLAKKAKRRKDQPFFVFMKSERGKRTIQNIKGSGEYSEETYDKFLTILAEKKYSVSEICKRKDMPVRSAIYNKKHRSITFKRKYYEILSSYPTPMQYKIGKYSDRVKNEIRDLAASGLQQKKIAKQLGISKSSVCRIIHNKY